MDSTQVKVSFENLAPADGAGVSPFWVGFHDGSFDLFDANTEASSAIRLVAEDGITGLETQIPGFIEFALSQNIDLSELPDPSTTVAGLFSESAGANGGTQDLAGLFRPDDPVLLGQGPGEEASVILDLENSEDNRFFSFLSMMFPTNDGFIANEDPLSIEVFDEDGNFVGADLVISGDEVWDAGTEVNDESPENIPFTPEGVGVGTPENGVIEPFPVPGFQPVGSGGALDVVDQVGDNVRLFSNADFTQPGVDVARLTISEVEPDEQPMTDPVLESDPLLQVDPATQLVTVQDETPTVSVQWDQAVQQAVTNTEVGPTIGSRAYAMVHTAIFDAWAAYDPTAIATQLGDDLQRPSAEITEANKVEAMSYAAYTVLSDLFPSEVEIFDQTMADLGFDPTVETTDTTTAAGVGTISAQALLEVRRNDGSNQLGDDLNGLSGVAYSDPGTYQPVNSLDERVDIARWTPEQVPVDAPAGEESRVQQFLTPQWGDVTPFALDSSDQFSPPAPQPFLLVDGDIDFESRTITLTDGATLDITQDLVGEIINPAFIEQVEHVIETGANLTDEQKLIAEFWEDPSGTSFPPGTWMTFGEFVSARDSNTLDEDAQMFFALGNAVSDAGIATWEAKRTYDYVRPFRAIRDLGELGLIGEFDADLGGFAIDAWGGPGEGRETILATDFLTYQTPGGDPSPPFSEYTSGHSAFSAAGAEILEQFTGSDEFGGAITIPEGTSRFEPNVTPDADVTLEWETFTEAADEAGASRVYGGIHFTDADLNGRILGQQVGETVWEEAQFFIQGGESEPVPETPMPETPMPETPMPETPMPETPMPEALDVTVTIESLAPDDGIIIAPVWYSFHDGSFDLFDEGVAASTPIELLAEDGVMGLEQEIPGLVEDLITSGFDPANFPAIPDTLTGTFDASDAGLAGGTRSALYVDNRDPLFLGQAPGVTISETVTLENLESNRFFSYASMLFPTNDAFIGNDDPTSIEIFDDAGNFVGADFIIEGNQVWDAGTEVNNEDPDFVPYSVNSVGSSVDQNDVVQAFPVPGFLPAGEGGILDVSETGVEGDVNYRNADFTQPGSQIARVTITAEPTEAEPMAESLLPAAPIFTGAENDSLSASNGSDEFTGDRGLMFMGAGQDVVDVSQATIGHNRIFGGSDADELIAGIGDRLYGGQGDDLLDASAGRGDNHLAGQGGNDFLLAGSGDYLTGGEGDDSLFITGGGDNLLTGGPGADAFWIASGELPAALNTITDFEVGTDVMGIGGLSLGFTDLNITQQSADTLIGTGNRDLAVLTGVNAQTITPDQFAFA